MVEKAVPDGVPAVKSVVGTISQAIKTVEVRVLILAHLIIIQFYQTKDENEQSIHDILEVVEKTDAILLAQLPEHLPTSSPPETLNRITTLQK
jgi:hypothetical protein